MAFTDVAAAVKGPPGSVSRPGRGVSWPEPVPVRRFPFSPPLDGSPYTRTPGDWLDLLFLRLGYDDGPVSACSRFAERPPLPRRDLPEVPDRGLTSGVGPGPIPNGQITRSGSSSASGPFSSVNLTLLYFPRLGFRDLAQGSKRSCPPREKRERSTLQNLKYRIGFCPSSE